jgi:hypothetical protein
MRVARSLRINSALFSLVVVFGGFKDFFRRPSPHNVLIGGPVPDSPGFPLGDCGNDGFSTGDLLRHVRIGLAQQSPRLRFHSALAIWLTIAVAMPNVIFAAAAPITIRVGYPQPSGAQLPLRAVLSVADHPKAASADPKDFFDNHFIKELEDTWFIKELYGQK